MKTNSFFKLSKSAKRMLALTKNKEKHGIYKNAFISAEVTFEESKKKAFKNNESTEG